MGIVAAFAFWAPPTASAAPILPTGFASSTLFSGLDLPTAVRFAPAPDTRVFVAEKRGTIQEFDSPADTTPTQVIDLRAEVFNQWDRGLLGLAVDPQFPAQPYLYALYTRDALPGGTAPHWGTAGADWDDCPQDVDAANQCVVTGRIVKIRVNPATNVADPATPPKVLLDGWCQQFTSHSVGDLRFGPDGALYASGGDGASYDIVDYGQTGSPCGDPSNEGGSLRSQDLLTTGDPTGLDGAVVRIDPDTGAAWPANPATTGPDANADRIVASGLRNPFRFTLRPGTDELWIGDVGWTTWEEVDRAASPDTRVENFGWPCYEGGRVGTTERSIRQPGFEAAGLGICQGLYAAPGAVTA
ncbi:MAG TPA: PQQ-dependent sugar dehydrogenase, partial [Solirubrobacteraceae bacterium]